MAQARRRDHRGGWQEGKAVSGIDAAELGRATEQLRQESETFAQRKWQDRWWFLLRLSMDAMAVVLLPSIACAALIIIFRHSSFPAGVVVASSTLIVDVVGIILAIWKLVIGTGSVTQLTPVTGSADNKRADEEAVRDWFQLVPRPRCTVRRTSSRRPQGHGCGLKGGRCAAGETRRGVDRRLAAIRTSGPGDAGADILERERAGCAPA
jgi:hypothetical protein